MKIQDIQVKVATMETAKKNYDAAFALDMNAPLSITGTDSDGQPVTIPLSKNNSKLILRTVHNAYARVYNHAAQEIGVEERFKEINGETLGDFVPEELQPNE